MSGCEVESSVEAGAQGSLGSRRPIPRTDTWSSPHSVKLIKQFRQADRFRLALAFLIGYKPSLRSIDIEY